MLRDYRNRPPNTWETRKHPPAMIYQKPQVVVIGNLTVVFIRDAQIVTMKWQYEGKTCRMNLKPWSPNWRRAVKEARKVMMRRNSR
jgi:hypothetical protein